MCVCGGEPKSLNKNITLLSNDICVKMPIPKTPPGLFVSPKNVKCYFFVVILYFNILTFCVF